jgi:hypothetical protein
MKSAILGCRDKTSRSSPPWPFGAGRRRALYFALVALAFTGVASAQQPRIDLRRDQAPRVVAPRENVTSGITPTPEMWFYEQERGRYDDPKMAVRRRAEVRAQQRQDRIASSEWYGMSNSRPVANLTPWFSSYSAYWGSNTWDPLRFRPTTTPLIVMRPTDGNQ